MASKLIYEQTLGETQRLINNFLLLFSPLLLRIMKIDNINGQSLQIVLI